MSDHPHPHEHRHRPHAGGVLLALAAAALFGVTTPLVAVLAEDLGPLTTAGLLYTGAALFALLMGLRPSARTSGRPLTRRDGKTLALMTLAGAVVAPTLFVVGLAATGPTATSLALNAEALFTVVFATTFMREPWHRDLALGVAAIAAGGVLLAWDSAQSPTSDLVGLLAVLGATAAWAVDNTLSRDVSEARPSAVIAIKGSLGALATLLLALAFGEPMPSPRHALLLVVGASGYGASLALYLMAQRRLGAARTGSLFAVGPFLGALVAFIAGDRDLGLGALLAVPLFGLGVWWHTREPHQHLHTHHALRHDHAHRHDDGHHDHHHDVPAVGMHSHPHEHARTVHTHAHAPDLHHRHDHS